MNSALSAARVYAILDLGYVPQDQLEAAARRILAGGAQVLQLRAKRQRREQIAQWAERLLLLTRPANVPLIINDHAEIAAEVGADGVHVGQDDVAAREARRIVGSDKILGVSTHSLAQARAAALEPVDYIGFGPLFATPTKPDYPAIGSDDIEAAQEAFGLPVFCIGGIKLENLAQVLRAGARRVVVVSGILQARDPEDYTRKLCMKMGLQ